MLNSLKATRKVSPLQRAKAHERRASYVIAGITGIILVLLFRSITIAATETAIAQERLLTFVVTIVQVAVSATSLVIVRHQIGLTTIEIEQAEHAELHRTSRDQSVGRNLYKFRRLTQVCKRTLMEQPIASVVMQCLHSLTFGAQTSISQRQPPDSTVLR